MPDMPDYSKYTLTQLEDVYKYVNRDKFPDRFKIIVDEIEKRKRDGDIQIDPKKDGVVQEQIFNKYKTFWLRFWARFIDGIVFIPLNLFGKMAFGTATTNSTSWIFSSVFLGFAYSVLMHGYFGQTLGKMILRVKVLDVAETKLQLRQAFLRDLVPTILVCLLMIFDLSHFYLGEKDFFAQELNTPLLILFYINVLWFLLEITIMLSNKKRRALHDFIAKSVVVKIT